MIGGASSGIGLAVAERLAEEGCSLVLWSRRKDQLLHIADELSGRYGTETVVVAADAQDPGAAETIADAALQRLGGADIVVLNAGGPPPVDAASTEPETWRTAIDLLAITPINVATRLLPGMRQQGWGRLIAVLSSGVRQPIPELAYSNAGRSALAAWMKTVSRSVAMAGVTVNGILPGRIDTARARQLEAARAEREGIQIDAVRAARIREIPAGRYGDPEELADLVAFLASDRARYITGTLIPVDGGLLSVQ
ncbi:MAG: SDR family oxidoreductase [Actinomycetota bacterium]